MSTQDLEDLHPNSLAAQDHRAQQTFPDARELADRASAQSGRPLQQILKEIHQGERWPGKMSALDYLSHGLYELDKSQRKEFISDHIHWPIHDICNDPEWSEKTTDKSRCTQILLDSGIETIPVLALANAAEVDQGPTRSIQSSDDLRDFLSASSFPLFAKPNRLLGSFGAFRIEAWDGERATLSSGEQSSADAVLNEVMAGIPYVLQAVVKNHDQLREFASGLATVRAVNLVEEQTVRMARAVLKIPVAGQIADNAWREGNLVANVDPETGVITRVISGSGPDLVEYVEHPETGDPLVGMSIPLWSELRELNERTARVFGALPFQSQDIALTNDGPVVVEVNSGASFALPQIASGTGMLTQENRRFFEAAGVNFRKLPSPQARAA